mgnify:CR=1 FL=1
MLRDLFSLFPAYAGVILLEKLDEIYHAPFPRIRGGDPDETGEFEKVELLFPAYAGVILGARGRRFFNISFPRIRGGDPKWHLSASKT